MFLKWKHNILSDSHDSVQPKPLSKEINTTVRKLYIFISLVWLLMSRFTFFLHQCGKKMYFCHRCVWHDALQQLKFGGTLRLHEGWYCFHNMYQIFRYVTRNQALIKTKADCRRETGEHQRAYSRKAEVVEAVCICVMVMVFMVLASHFLLIPFIRAVKHIQQSSRIVSTLGPPVGLRVLRFTVASLSCPRQQHLSPSVWALRHFPGI